MRQEKIRVLALALLVAGACLAQTAQITGIVKDSSDAVIVGADISVTNVDTGVRHHAKTNERGYYNVPLLKPGNYRLTVQASGFKPTTRENIALETGKTARIDFVLEVGPVTESVTVSERAPLLQTESSSHGQFIETKTVLDLPISGRRVESLVTLAGGAMLATTGSRVVLAGGRGGFVNWIVDGASSTPVLTEGLEFYKSPPVAEVKAFRVMMNGYAAEFGESESGVVSVTTKSGTNAVHGSLYEYLRNDKLDARTFFAPTKAPLRYNLFGFTVGGRWQRTRLSISFPPNGSASARVPLLSTRFRHRRSGTATFPPSPTRPDVPR